MYDKSIGAISTFDRCKAVRKPWQISWLQRISEASETSRNASICVNKSMNHGLHEPSNSCILIIPFWRFMTVKPLIASCMVGFGSSSTRLGEECWRLQFRWTSFATDASTSDSRWFNSNSLVAVYWLKYRIDCSQLPPAVNWNIDYFRNFHIQTPAYLNSSHLTIFNHLASSFV